MFGIENFDRKFYMMGIQFLRVFFCSFLIIFNFAIAEAANFVKSNMFGAVISVFFIKEKYHYYIKGFIKNIYELSFSKDVSLCLLKLLLHKVVLETE